MVSVCMITYNHEKYILEAINGVLMQETDFEIEFIIANDASTDATNGVISNLIKSYEGSIKIKYFHHPKNKGMMKNFIFALEECSGKYIALCEGDDYWTDPLKLQKQVVFLEGNQEYAGCFHNTDILNEMKPCPQLKPWRTYTKNTFNLKDTLSTVSLFHTTSFVFKHKLLQTPSWFSKVQSGDMALFTIIASQGPLYRIDESMSVYRKNNTGITSGIDHITYHTNRIKLFEYLNTYLKGREREYSKYVIDYHRAQLQQQKKTSIKDRIRQLFKM